MNLCIRQMARTLSCNSIGAFYCNFYKSCYFYLAHFLRHTGPPNSATNRPRVYKATLFVIFVQFILFLTSSNII